jgi:hypothetical protein
MNQVIFPYNSDQRKYKVLLTSIPKALVFSFDAEMLVKEPKRSNFTLKSLNFLLSKNYMHIQNILTSTPGALVSTYQNININISNNIYYFGDCYLLIYAPKTHINITLIFLSIILNNVSKIVRIC